MVDCSATFISCSSCQLVAHLTSCYIFYLVLAVYSQPSKQCMRDFVIRSWVLKTKSWMLLLTFRGLQLIALQGVDHQHNSLLTNAVPQYQIESLNESSWNWTNIHEQKRVHEFLSVAGFCPSGVMNPTKLFLYHSLTVMKCLLSYHQ